MTHDTGANALITEEQRLQGALGATYGRTVTVTDDGTICVNTGISGEALRAAFALRVALPNIQWTFAKVASQFYGLALQGTDYSGPQPRERRVVFIGSMVCGFRGSGSIDVAGIIAALMPKVGPNEEILRTIQVPSPGASGWQDSVYVFTISDEDV